MRILEIMIHLPVSSSNSFSFLRRIRNKSLPSSSFLPPSSPAVGTATTPSSTLLHTSSASFGTVTVPVTNPLTIPTKESVKTVPSSRTFATSVFAGRPLPKALFSVPFLREPKDFLVAAQNAVKVCNPLIASITQDSPHTPKVTSPVSGLRTLRKLDTISDTICKVLDAAECTRNIAGTTEWRNAAEEAFHGLSSYMYQLNAFRPLYEALCQITDDEVTIKALNEEQQRMAILLRREFERDGIHLSLSSREKVVQLNSDIGQLTSKYLSNMKEIEYLPIGLSGTGIEEAVHQLPVHIQTLFPSASNGALLRRHGSSSLHDPSSSPSLPNQHQDTQQSKEAYEHSPSIAAGALEAGGVSIAASVGNNESDPNTIIFPTDPGIVAEILRLMSHEYVRAKLMMTVHAAHTSNVSVLESIRIQRSILARQIGFQSYTHMMASDRMAGDPKNAILFLQRLAHAVMPRAALDFYSLANAKINDTLPVQSNQDTPKMEEVLGTTTAAERTTHKTIESVLSSNALDLPITRSLYQSISSSTGTYVRPWDIPYYSSHIIADKYHIDISMAAKYFPLSAVLDGLQGIMARVFGVTMVRLPVDGTESWITNSSSTFERSTDGSNKEHGSSSGGGFFGWKNNSSANKTGTSSSAQPLLLKYVLRHDVEGALGTMYLDLFSRPGKFGGAAHFVIRCGKRLHESDGAFEETMGVPPPPVSGTIGPTVQLPIIVLATNYAPPAGTLNTAVTATNDTSTDHQPEDVFSHVLMTPQEVETLFHEFGHALHSLLSRTEFQHLSGTRGALDFVEVPSHLMEYFARDFRVIRTFARHHITSEPMPEGLWTRIQSARSAFAGLDLQQAICTALYDQALFGSSETIRMILEDFPKLGQETVTEKKINTLVQSLKEYVDEPRNGSSQRIPTISSLSSEEMIIPLAAEHTLRPMPTSNEIGQQDTSSLPSKPLVDSTTLLSAIHERYNISPHLHTSKWHATFAHAATYGGGYYTYVYAAAISAALWQKLFQNEPFSRTAGELYRREVLSKGASIDPVTILHRILEGPPTMEPLLKELGLLVTENKLTETSSTKG